MRYARQDKFQNYPQVLSKVDSYTAYVGILKSCPKNGIFEHTLHPAKIEIPSLNGLYNFYDLRKIEERLSTEYIKHCFSGQTENYIILGEKKLELVD